MHNFYTAFQSTLLSTMVTSSPEPHVAVLSTPFASHPGSLFIFVKRLAEAAPHVKFTFFSSAKFNRALFSNTSSTPSNIVPHDIHDGIAENYVFVGKPMEDINLFLAVAADEFRRGVEVTKTSERKITCILCHAFLWFTCDLAQEIGVPWVPCWTAGACSITSHIYTDLIRQTLGVEGIEGRTNEKLNFIPGFSDLRLGDLPGGVIFGNLEWPFFVMLHKMGQTLPRADALILNSFEELDPDLIKNLKSKFKKIFAVCSIRLPDSPRQSSVSDEYGCLPWLEKHHPNSVAYIAFGTKAMLSPNEIVALAEALEASGTPFLWSMKDDLKKHFPLGFLDRTSELGKVVAWAPQVQVLSHAATGVFITHSGWGSVMESIAAGVPLICRPCFGDQSLNTWMIENVYKIGVRVEGGMFTKSGAIDALKQVLLQEKGKLFRKQSRAYKELAIRAVEPDGSSTENIKGLLEMISTT